MRAVHVEQPSGEHVICPVAQSAGNYDEYFGMATDVEAVVYLMLQNQLLHDLFPTVITIGEDVSGMPTFCRWGPWRA
jgi:hypothetical protein